MGGNAGTANPGPGSSKAGPANSTTGKKVEGVRGKDSKKNKQKDKLKCGENGKYGDLKEKTGDGKFDRDHVPSKAALKEFARNELRGGKKLCKKQARAIDKIGNAIAIPKGVHKDYSPTYGSKNTKQQIEKDASDLQKAARHDTSHVKQGLKNPCKKKYEAWQKKINNLTNNDYKKLLSKAIGKPRGRR